MKFPAAAVAVFAALALSACQRAAPPAKPATGDYRVQTWVLPAEAGSMAPTLVTAGDNRLLLGWINRTQGRRNALQFASYTEAAGWQSQPRTIAVGNSLLANAADTPHLLATPDGALWAQWLQAQADGASGYDAIVARSRDGGMSWNQLTRVNDDGQPVEHGFAALWPRGNDGLGIAWLDGRANATAAPPAQHGDTATQLRTNHFTLDLARGTDAVVAVRSCDCCQTAAAITTRGPLLAWRGRSDAEIRDIAVARFENGSWRAPTPVHADGWKISACPVAGPALAAAGTTAVVLWYSAANDKPLLQLARSTDAGDHFAAPVTLASGTAVLGRGAVGIDAHQVWAAWLHEDAHGQTLQLARYTPDLSKRLQTLEVAKLGTRGLASGYPQLAVDPGGAWLVWTDVANGVAHLKGARITR